MSIDYSKHSLFGASKAVADLFVQEYGRYFGMPTVSIRGGCLTGQAQCWHQATRFSVLSDDMYCERQALPNVRLQGQKDP